MDKELTLELLGMIRVLAEECQILTMKANATDNLLHDKSPYGLAYDHALGRASQSAKLQTLLESVSHLQEKLDPPPNEPRRGFQTEVKR
jgi:hypothetical protein